MRFPVSLVALAGLIGCALVVAASAFVLLGTVAQPANAEQRVAAVAVAFDQANTTPIASETPSLCDEGASSASAHLPERVGVAAERTGAVLANVEVAAGPTRGPVSAVDLTIDAMAVQSALTAFLGRLDMEQSGFYVRSLEFRPERGMVRMQLTGRVWCVA